eukprot:scaffold2962_cov126-Cylindrotheca_fusiformis.AAC.4
MKSWFTLFGTQVLLSVLVLFNNPLSLVASTTTTAESTSSSSSLSSSPFVGEWHLVELIDAKTGNTLPLPNQIMTVKLQSISETELSLGIKVGNSMGSTITLVDTTTATSAEIKVGPVVSTKMMPPQELWDVEQFLTKTLETVNKMEISNQEDNLVLEGDRGSIICSNK